MNFVAIDFETAVGHDSICTVGIVTVKDGKILEEYHHETLSDARVCAKLYLLREN